jgi:Domain of unknown function (DUF4123)
MRFELLHNALWKEVAQDKSLRVFSIQDAAASPRLHPNMVLSMTDHACLYEGRIPMVLEEAAPHIVRLAASATYTRWYLEEGWGKHWGILLQSKANLMDLRAHFQRLLIVKDEGGRKFSFRYFDPRVLRSYLPSCDSAELRTFFGPVARFFVPGEKGNELLEFHLEGNDLKVNRIDVQAPSTTLIETKPTVGAGKS